MTFFCSYEVAEFLLDVSLDRVESSNELLVAGYPVDDRVTQILLIFRLFVAGVELILSLLLQIESIVFAAFDAVAAYLQAVVDFFERLLFVVKTMHGASGTLVVHGVEFFVQEGVEFELPLLHSTVQKVEGLVVHVVHHAFILGDLEVVADLLVILEFLFCKVDISLVSHLLVGIVLFLPPWLKALVDLLLP